MRRLVITLTLAVRASVLSQTPPVWRVQEDLRIGSDVGPSSFNSIYGIAGTTSGNIFILDYKTQEIRVFDKSGKFLRLAARKGHGPGEIINADGLLIAPDGRIWVNDPSNARFSIYSPDGRFIEQVMNKPWGWTSPWGARFDDQGRLVERFAFPSTPGSRDLRMHFRRLRSDGAVIDTLRFPSCPIRAAAPPFVGRSADGTPGLFRTVPFQPQLFYVLDSRGTLWCTPGDEYVVYNYNLQSGDTIAVVRSAAPRPRVTAEERAAIVAQMDSMFAKFPIREVDYSRIPATKPAISGIFTDDLGRLWVQRTQTGAGTSEFDVWDSRGRQVASARLNFRVKMDLLSPFVTGDHLYAVIVDEDDVQYVVRAKIAR